VVCEPVTALAPDQAPEAVHAVAFVEDQANVAAAPLLMVLGEAEKLNVGAGLLTDTVADCVALPPAPLQVKVKVELLVSAPEDCEPLTAFAPAQAPEAVQEVALVADHVRSELAPLVTVLGLALMLTVAVGFAVTVTVADCTALPPGPAQLKEYVALAESAPVDCVPLMALAPVQAPEAVQEVAFTADQVRVDALPLITELGLTPRVTVGAGDFTDTEAD
jgi:hypothetical protein